MHSKFVFVFAALTVTLAARAQTPDAAGSEVQVNSYTTGSQEKPAVAALAEGGFVVVWQSDGSYGTDPAASIQGQRYASDGSPLGGQFQVNTYTASLQRSPTVAAFLSGDFVVVWHSFGSDNGDPSFSSIQGQRYASDGSPLGAQFLVNTFTTSLQGDSSVAAHPGGDFVVVWSSYGSFGNDSDYASIQGQRFTSDGSAAGSQFQVNSYTPGGQYYPAVAVAASGDFVVVWSSQESQFFYPSIQGQRFASDGTAVGTQFQISSATSLYQEAAVASSPDGGFVVAWHSDTAINGDGDSSSIQGRRYGSDGVAVGGQFLVNTYTTGAQTLAAVSTNAAGDFTVAWQSYGSGEGDTDLESVQGQRFASDGTAVGAQFQVDSYTTNGQTYPAVVVDAFGDFVVAWQSYGSYGSDPDLAVQGQRFCAEGDADNDGLCAGRDCDDNDPTPFCPIFMDGFESGDMLAWSGQVP